MVKSHDREVVWWVNLITGHLAVNIGITLAHPGTNVLNTFTTRQWISLEALESLSIILSSFDAFDCCN